MIDIKTFKLIICMLFILSVFFWFRILIKQPLKSLHEIKKTNNQYTQFINQETVTRRSVPKKLIMNKEKIEDALLKIHELINSSGLRFQKTYTVSQLSNFSAHHKVKIKLTGSYLQITALLTRVRSDSFPLLLSDVKLAARNGDPHRMVSAEFTINIFVV